MFIIKRYLYFMKLTLIILTFIFGLWLDQTIDFWGQLVTNFWVWTLFLVLLKKATSTERLSLIACLIYATLGEIFLSLVWGLYEYRLHHLPLFVPPGHVLLFILGVTLSKKIPSSMLTFVVLLAGSYVVIMTTQGLDTFGGILFMMFLGCLVIGKEKALYVTMFVLALLLEIYGTWLGNWMWFSKVPWLSLSSTNPPVCAGAFYCVLDLLVVSTVTKATRLPVHQTFKFYFEGATGKVK